MEKKHIDDIIKKYGNLLYRAVYVQVGNRHDTQDILQEAFIRYLEKAPVFADEEHEKAWLLQVTHHLCLDFFRFRKRHSYLELGEIEELIAGPEDENILRELFALPAQQKKYSCPLLSGGVSDQRDFRDHRVIRKRREETAAARERSAAGEVDRVGKGAKTMTEKQLKSVMDSITMPEAMAQELRKNVSEKKQKNRTFRYPKIAAAVIAGALILSVGTTSYAVYQAKNLRVFFEADVTEEQLKKAGEAFRAIEGVSEVEYVPGEQAWADFQAEYFADDPELAQEFDENPLADSFNYKLTVELSANTKEVREAIENVEGVRMVSDLSELK